MATTNLDTLQLSAALKSNDGTTVIDASAKSATFAGGVTANVTGNVTGGITGNITGNVTGNVTGQVLPPNTVLSGDGAISIPTAGWSTFSITKGSAAALTLAAPTAGTDDGKILEIVSETAFAHVITCGTDGFNAKGSSGTATYGAAKGNVCRLMARNGHWWNMGNTGITYA